MFFQLGRGPGKGIIRTQIRDGSLQTFRIPTALHLCGLAKRSDLRSPPAVGEDLLFYGDGSQPRVPVETFFPLRFMPGLRWYSSSFFCCCRRPQLCKASFPMRRNSSKIRRSASAAFSTSPPAFSIMPSIASIFGFQFWVLLQSFFQARLLAWTSLLPIGKTLGHGCSSKNGFTYVDLSFLPPRNPSPATHPWHCRQTTGDARETRCQGRVAGSPPASATPFPNSRLRDLPATAAAKTHPAPVAATTRTPTSNCRTSAVGVVAVHLISPARYPMHRQESPGPRGTDSG